MQNPDARHNMAELNQLFKLGLGEFDDGTHHLTRVMQPHGLMLQYDFRKAEVCAVSRNLADFLGQPAGRLPGRSLESVLGTGAAARILAHYHNQSDNHKPADRTSGPEELLTIESPHKPSAHLRAVMHTYADCLVLEMEPLPTPESHGPTVFADYLHLPLTRMLNNSSGAEKEVFTTFLEQIRRLSGYDQVGICQFDSNQNGQVVAEICEEMPPLLGLHFPTSAISSRAQALCRQQPLRLIPDVNYQPVKLYTTADLEEHDLKLANTFLRGASAAYLQYLSNMGVAAAMSVYIHVEQRLWGVLYCHHPRPKHIALDNRNAAQYLVQLLGLYLGGREKDREAHRRNSLHLLMQRMSFSQSGNSDHLRSLLEDHPEDLYNITRADGFIWIQKNKLLLESGIRIREQDMSRFVKWLDDSRQERLYYSTCSLPYTEVINRCFYEYPSGLLAIPLPEVPGTYLVWFRIDRGRALHWAITPDKNFPRDNGQEYHASYADYEKQVSGLATPWTQLDIDLALEFSRTLSFVNSRQIIDKGGKRANAKSEKQAKGRQQECFLDHQYRTLVDTSPDAIAALAHDGQLIVFNPRFEEMYEARFGIKPRVGDNCADLLPAPIRAKGKSPQQRAIGTESYLESDISTYTNRQGKTLRTFTSYSILYDAQGNRNAIQLIIRDISHLWCLGEEARSLSQKYGLLTEKILPLVWGTDAQGHFCEEQPSWAKFTGQQRHEYAGAGWLKAIHMQDRPHFQAYWEQCNSNLQTFAYTARVWSQSSDSFRNCLIYMMPILEEKHKIGEWFGAAIDIHELKEKEEQLEKTLLALKDSNEQLKNFAHVASHDLQEPLRVVKSYLSLVEERYEKKLDPGAMELIRFAIDGADRMKGLIRELLNYAQLGTEFTPEKVRLDKVVAKVLDGLKLRIAETGARVEVSPLPEVKGVAMLFEQLFTNLLSNSLKFKAEDVPPRIRIRVKERRLSWKIRVEDNGPGIDPHYVDRIFQIFFRMGSRTKFPGTGMGLAICKRIVNMHGGKIWVNQDYKGGTCIEFTLRKYLEVE